MLRCLEWIGFLAVPGRESSLVQPAQPCCCCCWGCEGCLGAKCDCTLLVMSSVRFALCWWWCGLELLEYAPGSFVATLRFMSCHVPTVGLGWLDGRRLVNAGLWPLPLPTPPPVPAAETTNPAASNKSASWLPGPRRYLNRGRTSVLRKRGNHRHHRPPKIL